MEDYPLDTWHAVLGVKLTGSFMVTQRAIPLLSPLLTEVREALGIGTAGATFLGMLPTL